MDLLIVILIFTLLGSVISAGIAAVILFVPADRREPWIGILIPYAIGTLLGAAFLGMIPDTLLRLPASTALSAILAGIILFFAMEKLAIWRHCHRHHCEIHSRSGPLILIGDSLHNFVDGIAIAAAFSTSTSLGIATSVAVIAHEVPQEVGDFAILLSDGYSRGRAFLYNLLSSMAAILGAVLMYAFLAPIQGALPYFLALSAASFVYIALADLVPGRRDSFSLLGLVWEILLIAAGIATIRMLQLASGALRVS